MHTEPALASEQQFCAWKQRSSESVQGRGTRQVASLSVLTCCARVGEGPHYAQNADLQKIPWQKQTISSCLAVFSRSHSPEQPYASFACPSQVLRRDPVLQGHELNVRDL